MFTELVEQQATVVRRSASGAGDRLVVETPAWPAPPVVGESVAVSGCCLTVAAGDSGRLEFDIGPETLQRTTLGRLVAGDRVNLERSLRVGDRVGGHYVTGHIDAVGGIEARRDTQEWSEFWIGVPAWCVRQIAPQGSVAVDGVSLTLVEVQSDRFSVMLIPHTLAVTTLGERRAGDAVNIETDVLAKYVHAQLVAAGIVEP